MVRRSADGVLRVLLVCGALQPELDGVADAVVRLAEALRRHGARVRILHTGPPGRVTGGRSVGPRWTPAALLRAVSAVRAADVVHVQFAPSMYRYGIGIGLLPAVAGRTPLVTTVHEYGWWRWDRLLPAAIWQRLERSGVDRETLLLVPASTTVVTTNAAHAAAVAERFGNAVATVVVPIGANVGVAPGTDRSSARLAVRRDLGLDPAAVLLAFFGFVHPVKGVRYLVDAVAALVAEGRDVHLLVVGGFTSLALPEAEARTFEAELRAAIRESGAEERVTVTGHLPAERVSRLLAAADVAVLPFTAGVTSKSGSLLTVLAHGLPTVVTAAGDPELVDGDRVVAVDRVRDGAALVDGVRRLLDDPAAAGRIAEAGAAWAAEHDWDRIAERHLAVYRRGDPVGAMIRSVVVVDTMGGLGDLMLALPVIEALGRSSPAARLTVVTTAPWHVLLERDARIAEVVPVPRRDAETVVGAVRPVLERLRPDLAVTTSRQHGLPDLLTAMSGRAITDLWRHPPADEPVDLRMLRLLADDGVVDPSLARLAPRLVLDPDEVAAGGALLDTLGAERPTLLLPDSGMAVKQWPLDRWAALIRRSGDRTPIVVSQVSEQRARLTAAGAVLAPPLGLRELAGLCAAAAGRGGVAVGGDTGPVRVAAASGLEVVGLFGPTLAARYGYRGGRNLQGYPACPVRTPTSITEQECWWTARCPLTPDHAPRCMADISVEAVRSVL